MYNVENECVRLVLPRWWITEKQMDFFLSFFFFLLLLVVVFLIISVPLATRVYNCAIKECLEMSVDMLHK